MSTLLLSLRRSTINVENVGVRLWQSSAICLRAFARSTFLFTGSPRFARRGGHCAPPPDGLTTVTPPPALEPPTQTMFARGPVGGGHSDISPFVYHCPNATYHMGRWRSHSPNRVAQYINAVQMETLQKLLPQYPTRPDMPDIV